jgi:hypothetical protein
VVRGRGLKPAELGVAGEAAVIDASARAAFDLGPGLVLLLHPNRLPRTAGTEGGAKADRLISALRERGTVAGWCDPRHDMPRDTPRCGGMRTGYVIRASDVFRMPGDTVEVWFAAEAFGPDRGPRPMALRFEKIYQLVGRDERWRVVREARVKGE